MVLTLDDAQRLVRDALDGSGAPEATILPERTVERPFGWVFVAMPASNEYSRANPAEARIIIVNKYSREILGAPFAFFVQNCLNTYERLVKAQGHDWCLTLGSRWRWSKRERDFSFERRELEKVGLTVLTPSEKSRDI